MQTLMTTILPVFLWLVTPASIDAAETVLINEIAYLDGVYYHDNHVFSGDIVDYYENDKLKFRYKVLEGKLNGKATEFFANGKVKSIRHYTLSKLFGEFVEYFDTGEVKASFDVKLNAYNQGEIIEKITIGQKKKGKIKTRNYDEGLIFFIGGEGETFDSSELIFILNQTVYRITDKSRQKVLLEVN